MSSCKSSLPQSQKYNPKRSVNVPDMIVELKWDKSAEGAIGQIKDKGYVDALKEYKGNLLLVGINYDIDVLGLILSLSIKSVCLVTPLYQIQGIFFCFSIELTFFT